MKASVVLSTYNAVEWLEKVLWGFECQTYKDFEVVIADDGSGPATADLIRQFSATNRLNIKHVWHEDRGFQKSAILNKAIVGSSYDYMIFTDGDCIPRRDFVAVHMKHSAPGRFLSGGYFMLPMETSKAITRDDIYSSRCFDVTWLKQNGLTGSFKTLKLSSSGITEKVLNFLTPTKATWNGHNSSGWKRDIVAVNGFNEEMQYGGQDRELGERLVNYGIVGKQIRYSAICIHLDHKRSYKTPESIAKNQQIRRETRETKRVWTEFGIVKKPQG